MLHPCVRCHSCHLACNTPGSVLRNGRNGKKNSTTSKKQRIVGEERQEATGATTMTAKANTVSRTKSARKMAIDDELIEEQGKTDLELNDETGEESASPEPRKSESLRNTAPAKAATHDSNAVQDGSTAFAGVHLNRGRLPVMNREEHHARLKNKDQVLAQLAKAQSNKIKVLLGFFAPSSGRC